MSAVRSWMRLQLPGSTSLTGYAVLRYARLNVGMNDSVFYIFAYRHAHGVPEDPVFVRLMHRDLAPYIQEKLTRDRKQKLHVWDWQPDGVRHRFVKLSGTRLEWTDPDYLWLARHRTREE